MHRHVSSRARVSHLFLSLFHTPEGRSLHLFIIFVPTDTVLVPTQCHFSPSTPPCHKDPTVMTATLLDSLMKLSMDSPHIAARAVPGKPHSSYLRAVAPRHQPTHRRKSEESISEEPPVRKPKSSSELYAYAVPSVW